MSLSGRILPIHPSPNDGESLSSWLTRLSIFHHLAPSIFFRISIRSQQDVFKQDIDIKCPQSVLEEISVFTGKSLHVVEQTTFMSFQDYLYIHNQTSKALPRWIGPAYIRKNTEHHFGLKICPECMRESPYVRLLWRCTFFVVCPQHGIRLIDRCERCGSPKSTRRIFAGIIDDQPDEALCFCHNCGWDYRQANLCVATESEKNHVSLMLSVMEKGFYKSLVLEVGYSHLFFSGIRLIMNGLFRFNANEFGIEEKNSELEFKSVDLIASIIEKMFVFIESWPNDFVEFSFKNNLGKSYWVRPREIAPYWLVSVLRRYLNFEKYSASVEEIESASMLLRKSKNAITGKDIVYALGMKSPPRKFHSFSKPMLLSKSKLRYEIGYAELEKLCLQRSKKFVALRTIIYATIYTYTSLKLVEVAGLVRAENISNFTQFRNWLRSIGFMEINSDCLENLWRRYRDYILIRDTIDPSLNGRLFLSRSGNAMDASLAVKSLERLLL
jgi:hypothetical protein